MRVATVATRPTPVSRELPPWELDRETEEELNQRKGVFGGGGGGGGGGSLAGQTNFSPPPWEK